jgi:low molecular weight phosphotyrosine protein phosphatase
MDRSNLSDLQRLQRGNPDSKAKVMLYGEFSGKNKPEIVNDPYYGGVDGFTKAFEQCSRFAENFLNEVVGGAGKQ